MIQDKIEKMNSLRKEILSDILGNNELTKLGKLKLITEQRLWRVHPYVQNEFKDWENECNEKEKESRLKDTKTVRGFVYDCTTNDSFLRNDNKDKYATYIYIDEINNILEEYELTDDFLVMTNRGDYETKLYKKVSEVIDRICDYCLENEIIGFTFDW